MRPTSRGAIIPISSHPFIHPQIYANYLSTDEDRQDMRMCVRAARYIFAQRAFDDYRGDELAPGKDIRTDEEIDTFIRARADSAYHPCGTCKMGLPNSGDPGVVVDARTLKVLGTENLRVVDASIMPSVLSGNLNAPVIMMAEKAADIIRGNPPLPKAHVPIWTPTQVVQSV